MIDRLLSGFRNLLCIGCLTSLLGLHATIAAEQQGAETAPVEPAAAPNLAASQEAIEMKYRRFEGTLMQLSEYLRKTDPARADLLLRASGKSKEGRIPDQLQHLTELLKKDQLGDAVERQELVVNELQSLLVLLMSEARKDDLELEKKRIQDLIKDVNKLISKETDARANTERGGNQAELQTQQKQVADSTKKLVEKIESQDAARKANQTKPAADAKNQSDADKKDGDAESDDKDNPDAEDKDESSSDEDGKPGKSDGKPSGKQKNGDPPSKAGDKNDSKSGESNSEKNDPANEGDDPKKPEKSDKPGEDAKPDNDPKDKSDAPDKDSKKPQAGKPQAGKPKTGKPQQGKPQQGKPQEGEQPQDGQDQQDQQDQQDESPQQDDSSQKNSDKTPGRDELKRAKQEMDRAIEELKRNNKKNASDKQDKAIAELMKAKEKLEEILRQLREEERELVLAQLEARFRDMLQKQETVNNATLAIHAVPVDQRTDRHRNRSVELARNEEEISVLAAKSLTLLKEEGSSVAFPEAVEQIREDMLTVSRRLERVDVSEITQNIEQDIAEGLKEIIEALQKEIEKMKDKKQQQQQQQDQQQQQQQQQQGLVNKLAELKMLRSLQYRVNRRTKQLGRLVDGEQALDLDIVSQLRQLSDRQSKVQKATYDLSTGKNQ